MQLGINGALGVEWISKWQLMIRGHTSSRKDIARTNPGWFLLTKKKSIKANFTQTCHIEGASHVGPKSSVSINRLQNFPSNYQGPSVYIWSASQSRQGGLGISLMLKVHTSLLSLNTYLYLSLSIYPSFSFSIALYFSPPISLHLSAIGLPPY